MEAFQSGDTVILIALYTLFFLQPTMRLLDASSSPRPYDLRRRPSVELLEPASTSTKRPRLTDGSIPGPSTSPDSTSVTTSSAPLATVDSAATPNLPIPVSSAVQPSDSRPPSPFLAQNYSPASPRYEPTIPPPQPTSGPHLVPAGTLPGFVPPTSSPAPVVDLSTDEVLPPESPEPFPPASPEPLLPPQEPAVHHGLPPPREFIQPPPPRAHPRPPSIPEQFCGACHLCLDNIVAWLAELVEHYKWNAIPLNLYVVDCRPFLTGPAATWYYAQCPTPLDAFNTPWPVFSSNFLRHFSEIHHLYHFNY